jgi:hypothetical protein
MALQRQEADFRRQMAGITQRQRQAVEEADTETWESLEREKAGLLQQRQPPQQEPDYAEQYGQTKDGFWVKDPELGQVGYQMIEANPAIKALPPERQLKYVESELKRFYPDRFEQEEKPKPQTPRVDGGGLASPGGKFSKSAYDKLPAEAKTQFKRFVSQGLFEDTKAGKEEYANEYFA